MDLGSWFEGHFEQEKSRRWSKSGTVPCLDNDSRSSHCLSTSAIFFDRVVSDRCRRNVCQDETHRSLKDDSLTLYGWLPEHSKENIVFLHLVYYWVIAINSRWANLLRMPSHPTVTMFPFHFIRPSRVETFILVSDRFVWETCCSDAQCFSFGTLRRDPLFLFFSFLWGRCNGLVWRRDVYSSVCHCQAADLIALNLFVSSYAVD
jgi:hypothetical protein